MTKILFFDFGDVLVEGFIRGADVRTHQAFTHKIEFSVGSELPLSG
jgi:hypothetical protein